VFTGKIIEQLNCLEVILSISPAERHFFLAHLAHQL